MDTYDNDPTEEQLEQIHGGGVDERRPPVHSFCEVCGALLVGVEPGTPLECQGVESASYAILPLK